MNRQHCELESAARDLGVSQDAFAGALRDTAKRYERLVQLLSILKRIDDLDDPDLSPGAVFQKLTEIVAFEFTAENCSLALLERSAGVLGLRAACGPLDDGASLFEPGRWEGKAFRIGEGVVGEAARTRRAIRVDDVTRDARFVELPESPVRVRSLLCCPLVVGGEALGVLNVSHSEPGAFSVDAEAVLGLAVGRAARLVRSLLHQQELREQNEQYRIVAESAGVGVLVFDAEGLVTEANIGVEEIGRRPVGDFLGRGGAWEEMVHPGDAEAYAAHRRNLFDAHCPDSLNYRLRDGQGRVRFLEEYAWPLRNYAGRFSGVACVIRDATTRSQAVEALQESLRTSAEIVQSIPSALMILRYEAPDRLVLLSVNPAAENFAGLALGRRRGREFDQVFEGVDTGELKPDLLGVMKTGRAWETNEAVFDDGKHLHHYRLRAFCLSSGRLGVAAEDVSDLRHAEVERNQLATQLGHAQKMEAIGTLAGGIAHDFNNILFSILGYADLELSRLPADSPARNSLREILNASDRAADLVRQILTFSRQSEQERRPIRVQPVLKEAIKFLRGTIPATIGIETQIDRDCGPIFADPTRIHQVIMNLCTNAYHAMNERGGVLRVRLTTTRVDSWTASRHPELDPSTSCLQLVVEDTGEGMAPGVVERIFEPYFSTKPPGGGTGLGLATAHGIVTSCSGVIDVESRPGLGTTFTVYIPHCPDEDAPRDSSGMQQTLPIGSERILFVDDEQPVGRMMREVLTSYGYEVDVFASSERAWEVFLDSPHAYDVVVLDQIMPCLTGVELARRILQERPDMPILICTGFSETLDEAAAREAGVRDFATKPIAPRELAGRIRRLLDGQA